MIYTSCTIIIYKIIFPAILIKQVTQSCCNICFCTNCKSNGCFTLTAAKVENFFYAAILWGKSPFKVIEDAQFMLKRERR